MKGRQDPSADRVGKGNPLNHWLLLPITIAGIYCMTANAVTETTVPLAQHTVGRVNAGMDSNRVPMVGQILKIIRDISGNSERMSVGDLVEFIGGEPTMMGRIVTIASSVGYNARGVEINSIHHAISLIGFDQVRTLAISILLLEGAHSETVARANRELAGMSLISGLVAAEICRRRGAPTLIWLLSVAPSGTMAASWRPPFWRRAILYGSVVT